MPFTPKSWQDRPTELNPNPGESLRDWLARIATYAAANPGVLTPLDAAGLIDLETRLSDYTDGEITALLASVTSMVTAKANVASPALTGTPTAPTPTAGDDSTKIATTEFVADAVAAGGGGGVTPLSWTGLVYETGWADMSSSWYPAGWAKDDYGIVHLRGAASKSAAWFNPEQIAVLPVGARPARQVRVPLLIADTFGAPFVMMLHVWDTGEVQIEEPAGGSSPDMSASVGTYLDGISFPSTV